MLLSRYLLQRFGRWSAELFTRMDYVCQHLSEVRLREQLYLLPILFQMQTSLQELLIHIPTIFLTFVPSSFIMHISSRGGAVR